MTLLQQAEALIPQLSEVELERLLQKMFGGKKPEFPGIEKTPGVCGGRACVIRTRIPVWTLVNWKNLDVSDEQLLEFYPTLRRQDLVNAWAYFKTHQAEIEFDIQENEA